MGVKADWGTSAVADPPPTELASAFDPVALASSEPMLKPATAEKPLDLSTSEPKLRKWLGELLRREGNLWECGVTCPLKDGPDGNCTACPVSRAHETQEGTLDEERLKRLCQIGAEQERVSMLLQAKRHHGV